MKSVFLKIATSPDLVEQVYRNPLGAIGDGSIAPGARLTQEGIANIRRAMGWVLQVSTMRGSIWDEAALLSTRTAATSRLSRLFAR